MVVRFYNHRMPNRALDWLKQAENDLLWIRDTLRGGHWAQTCFVAQQTAEKAIKALALDRGFDSVKSRSISEITKALGENGDLERMAKGLVLY
jgi:HEPN domain-containing protein